LGVGVVWIRSTRVHGAPVFTSDLLPFRPASTGSLPPFAMWPAFPTSDYYEGSATPQGHQPTTCLPA